MDHRFIVRPRLVQAFQLTDETRADNSNWPQWLHDAWNKGKGSVGAVWPNDQAGSNDLMLNTGAGSYVWPVGDWIICHRDGSFRLYKDDSFATEFVAYARQPVANLEKQLEIAKSPGNGDANRYMRGMANGLICAMATMLDEEPQYLTGPTLDENDKQPGLSITDDAHHEAFMRQRAVEIAISAAPHIFEGGSPRADEIMAFAQKIVTFTSPLITLTGGVTNIINPTSPD
jgi:hypothetical protein